MLDPTAQIFPRPPIKHRPHKPTEESTPHHKSTTIENKTQGEETQKPQKADRGNGSISTMNALDSPLDALVLDVAGFGILTIVNNLWTWVALITAAVSFWRIRTAGAGVAAASRLLKSEPPTPACIDLDDGGPQPVPETSATEPRISRAPPAAHSLPSPSVFEDNGTKKGKFVEYFEDVRGGDDKDDDDGELTEVEERGYGGFRDDVCREWCDGWDRLLRLRVGEMEWYGYQDLTAINGNVVRLWDGVRREKYSSSCECLVW